MIFLTALASNSHSGSERVINFLRPAGALRRLPTLNKREPHSNADIPQMISLEGARVRAEKKKQQTSIVAGSYPDIMRKKTGGSMQTVDVTRRKFGRGLALLALVIGFSVVIAHSGTAQTPPGDVLTLKRAVEIALENQPVIQAQTAQVRAGEAKVGQARAGYLPQVSLAGQYSRINPVNLATSASTSLSGAPPGTSIPSGVSGTTGSYEQYITSANLSQLIFDFGKTPAQITAQKHGAQAARFNLENTKQETVFTVKQAYYALLGTQAMRRVAVEAVEQFKEHLQHAKALYDVGVKPRFDVTKAEVDLSNAELNLIDAENNVTLARVNLNNAMGQPSAPEYTVEEEPIQAPFDLPLEAALEIASKKRSDLRSMQEQKESSRQSLRATEKGYFPIISGVASYTYVGTTFPLDDGWTAGLSIVFPIFSGFLTKYQAAEARASLDVVAANEVKLWQTIRLEMEQAYVGLKRAVERTKNTEITLRQARENRDLATERYETGVATPVEVTDALVAYTNAQANHVAALYEHKVALARIDKATGGQ
jgi:outer membrane protein